MATIQTFNAFNRAPGVYIQEITLPGPLPQVSTSIAAFVGPAEMGPLNQPTELTSIKQFNNIFGSYIESPYRIFAAHAVNGFFNEGGQQCYFVRVGNGLAASLPLSDQANLAGNPKQTTLVVTAKEEGVAGNNIKANVTAGGPLGSAPVVSAQTTTANPQSTLSAAAKVGDTTVQLSTALPLRPGQVVTLAQAAPPTNENAVVKGVSGNTVALNAPLANAYAAGSAISLTAASQTTLSAAASAGATSVTVASAAGFMVGELVNLAQPAPAAKNENAVIANIAGNTITLQSGLVNAYPNGSTFSTAPNTGATSIVVAAAAAFRPGDIVNLSQPAAAAMQTTLSAAAASGATSVTVASAAGFMIGEHVNLAQVAPGTQNENAVIANVVGTTITLQSGLVNAYAIGDTFSSVPPSENTTIASISGSIVNFQSALANAYPTGSAVRIADLTTGQQQIRVASVAGFEPGSYVKISNGGGANTDSYDVVRLVNTTTNIITLTNGLTNMYPMAATSPAVNVTTMEFTLTVVSPSAGTEVFQNLAMDPRHSRYYGTIVNSSAFVLAPPPLPDTTPPPLNVPVDPGALTALANGKDDNLATLGVADYQKGITALEKFEVDLLCIPDAVTTWPTSKSHFQAVDTQAIQAAMIAHCQHMQDRFAILDCSETPASAVDFSAVQSQRQGLNSDNGYGALYFPWIGISNPFGSKTIFVPPSGHTAGVFANNDNTFDVAHAPANEPIANALSVEVLLSDADQGPLNEQGINVIRLFSGAFRIWGARTIAPPDRTAWRYVNVRRLLLYIEKTLRDGTREFVFAPNNLTTWQQLKRLVTDFLTQLWQAGDLFGATPEQAFRVQVDSTLNTPDVVALGQLIVQVTVVPTHPAEFIVFQVIQDPTGASLKESTT